MDVNAELNRIATDWHDYLVLTQGDFFGIDLSFVATRDSGGRLILLSATLEMATTSKARNLEGEHAGICVVRNRVTQAPTGLLAFLQALLTGRLPHQNVYGQWPIVVEAESITPLRGMLAEGRSVDDVVWVFHRPSTQPTQVQWERFEDALRAGRVIARHRYTSSWHLWDELGVVNPREVGQRSTIQARVPRRGTLNASCDDSGNIIIHARLAKGASLRNAQLFATDYEEGGITCEVGLATGRRHDDGDHVAIEVDWHCGASRNQQVQLMYHDRLLSEVSVQNTGPMTHAYLALDPGAKKLAEALFPADGETKDTGRRFESACATLLSILGFSVTCLDALGIQGDLLVPTYVGANRAHLLVECSLKLKDRSKIAQLKKASEIVQLGAKSPVIPVLATCVDASAKTEFEINAAGGPVRIVYRGQLRELLRLALAVDVSNRQAAALAVILGK